jgi:hypothetical protein
MKTDKDRLFEERYGSRELTLQEQMDMFHVPDYCRLQVWTTDRYACGDFADILRGLANQLDHIKQNHKLTDLQAASKIASATRASNNELKLALLGNKVSRDISKQDTALSNIVTISGGS